MAKNMFLENNLTKKPKKSTGSLKYSVLSEPSSANQAGRQAEEEIRTLKQQMEFILGVTKTGLDIIDSEFNIRYIDPEWAKIYGDPTGKKCHQYFMDRNEVCPDCGIPKALNTKKVAVTEEVLVKEGNRPIQVTTIPFQNRYGEWLVAEVNIDITERKRIEEELHKIRNELEIRVQERTAELMRFVVALQNEMAEHKLAEEALQRSEKDAKRLAQENTIMAEIGRIVSSTLDIEEVYERFAEEVHRLIPFDGIAINIISHKESNVIVPYVSGIGVPGCQPGDVFPLEGSVTGEIARMRSGLIIQTEDKNELQARFPTILTAFDTGLRSVIAVPLISKDQVIGAIHFRSAKPNAYSKEDLRLAESIGSQIAGAIANAQLFTDHKQTEEKLRESEEKYRTILENIEDGYYEVDLPGNFTFFNDSLCRMLGYSRDEMIGMGNQQYTDQENRKKLFQAFNQVFRTGEPTKGFDWQIMRKDGAKQFGEVSISLIKDSKGQPIGFRGIARDITERKQAEDALRHSEDRYRTLVEESFDGIFVQKGFKIVFANQRLHEMLGYEEGELIGRDHWLAYHPDYQELTRERGKARMRGESVPTHYEVKLQRKDGASFDGEINARKIMFGKEPGIQVWVRDNTERKCAEETLRQSEAKYRVVADNTYDWEFWLNPEGQFAYISPSCKRITGHDAHEFVADPNLFNRIIHPEDLSLFIAHRREVENKIASNGMEFRIIRPDGTSRWISHVCQPVFDTDGIFLGTRGSNRDITERKRAEEALRESEERYRNILTNIEDGYYEVDIAGSFTFFNDSLCKILGYSKQEMIRMNNRVYMDEETARRVYQAFNQVYNAGEPLKAFGYKIIRKDGTERFLESHVSLLRNAKGERIGFRGIARDITERKQAEEALRTQQQRFQTLSENAPFGMVRIDKDGTFKYINPKFRELFGYDLTDVPNGKTWFRKAYPDPIYRHHVIAEWIKDLERLKRGEKRPRTFKAICKDGTKKIINFIPVQLVTGEHLMACEDITERKQAEETLRKSEESAKRIARENAIVAEIGRIISSSLNIDEVYERFTEEVRKLIPFDRIMINIINPDKKTVTFAYIRGINISGRQIGDVVPLAGTGTEEVMRTRSSLLVQTENIGEVARRFPGLLPSFQAGLRSMILVPLISKDQFIGALSLRSSKPNAYTDQDMKLTENIGVQIAGAIANAQLFAEHIRSEEEKLALQEQLRQSQKMEAVGQLAGGIAHDFNNLLTVIKGYSQLSLLDLKENDPLWGNIQEIQKATQRATDLTRQLLAFSRRQILDLKVLDLNTLLKDLEKMLHRIIGEDIELTTLLAENLGKVKIDPGQFEQMILNLAVNARDAMPSGGKLTIETVNVVLDEEYAHTHISVTPGPYVRLSVSDTGVGISLELKEKVFEPFFTTKEKGKGTGLGLSTVYGIVKQSGGNIWVYSEPSHGTTFKIYLPRVEEDIDTLHGRDETDFLPRGGETVLLVEDEPSVRDLAHRLLNQQGYKVLEAANGEEALHVAQEHAGEKIHLLLTDVVMPRMGGKELADQLKILRPDIKVLYASGYTDNAIVHHGVLERGTHFLQKPFSPSGLVRKVREVLDR